MITRSLSTFQDNLREAGCLGRLQKLLDDHNGDPRVQRAAMAAVGNLALNTANQREMAVSRASSELSEYSLIRMTSFTNEYSDAAAAVFVQ